MTLGRAPNQDDAFRSTRTFCEQRLSPMSVYRLLHDQAHTLFTDELFADLFQKRGRDSVPPRVVAVVMTLQRIEGLSDREAVQRFEFDVRWKYAAGGLDFEYPGFVHTVLVDMRARLRDSERPDRIFDVVLDLAKSVGLVGRKRVLDSTALYDAVATQDTVTMIRSSIRGLLQVANTVLADELRTALKRDDDYASAGKPSCDWDDESARDALIDALARDAKAVLMVLHGREIASEVRQAAQLVATIVGQDLEEGQDGVFRIARRVTPDRIISTVDPESRHGHKTAARGFDGYKGHIAIDPDSEIITDTAVTAANQPDGSVAKALLNDVLPAVSADDDSQMGMKVGKIDSAAPADLVSSDPVEVYGDASYGTGEILEHLEGRAIPNVKVQPASARDGRFSKDEFEIDLERDTVRCPAGVLVQIRRLNSGPLAEFGAHCANCPLRKQCTDSKTGRVVKVHKHERHLQRERARQKDVGWKAKYKATRPKVERKHAHLMRRRHGGRRARMRGCIRIAQDFALLAAATNIQRLAVLLADRLS